MHREITHIIGLLTAYLHFDGTKPLIKLNTWFCLKIVTTLRLEKKSLLSPCWRRGRSLARGQTRRGQACSTAVFPTSHSQVPGAFRVVFCVLLGVTVPVRRIYFVSRLFRPHVTVGVQGEDMHAALHQGEVQGHSNVRT